MSGRMNWDRVRKENLAHQHGSEWVTSVADELRRPRGKRPKAKRQPKRRQFAARPPMPGCTCGKPVGFSGEHRKACPIRKNGVTNQTKMPAKVLVVPPSPPPKGKGMTLGEFVRCLKRASRHQPLRDFVLRQLDWLAKDRKTLMADREEAERALRAMLEKI